MSGNDNPGNFANRYESQTLFPLVSNETISSHVSKLVANLTPAPRRRFGTSLQRVDRPATAVASPACMIQTRIYLKNGS